MEADEILDRGAQKIQTRGWCRNGFSNNKGEICAMGALRMGLHNSVIHPIKNTDEYYRALHALAEVFVEQYGADTSRPHWATTDFSTIARVNDRVAESVQEIISCMEKAAVNLRSEAID